MPKRVWTDEMKAIAAGMKRAGFSAKAIAARLGVTPSAASNTTTRLGARRSLDGHHKRDLKYGRLVRYAFDIGEEPEQ
jgi:predicted transcriptional regulator